MKIININIFVAAMGMEKEQLLGQKKQSAEKLPSNVVELERPEAIYRMVYGKHTKEQDEKEIGSPDAIVLESSPGNYSTAEDAEWLIKVFREGYDSPVGQVNQKTRIIKKAEDENIPIFFVDLDDKEIISRLQIFLTMAESGVGAALLYSLIKDIKSEKKISRREFFKRSAKGIGGAYLASHLTVFSHVIGGGQKDWTERTLRDLEKFADNANEKIHPETYSILLTLRNHIMAEKMQFIAKSGQLGEDRPKIAAVLGRRHRGIEQALQKNENDRLEIIHKLFSCPGLEESRREAATIARLDFSRELGKWKTTEIFQDPAIVGKLKKGNLLGGGGGVSGGHKDTDGKFLNYAE